MMLTLRGLPPDITKTEIRSIIQNKCSIQHVMLDELGREGSTQRVTIACMDARDASAVMRGMDGARLGPYMITVEPFRVQPQQEIRRTIDSPVNDYEKLMPMSPPPERSMPPWERSENLFSRRVQIEDKDDIDRSFEGSTRMVQRPQMVPQAQIVPRPLMVPHPQIVPPPLMGTPAMRPQELVQYPQIGRPGIKPYFMTQSVQSRSPWMGESSISQTQSVQSRSPWMGESSISQNQMSDLNGFGLGTSSQAIPTTRMPPWEEERLKRAAPPRSEFRERSPLARDFGSREERMRGRGRRDELRLPSPDRRIDSQSRHDPERRRNFERRPANRSPPRDSRRKRPRSPSPRRTGTLNKIQRGNPERMPSHNISAKTKFTTQPSDRLAQSKQQHNSHGVVRYVQHSDKLLSTKVISWIEQATSKVVPSIMGTSPSPGTSVKAKYTVMMKALKDEIKARMQDILRNKTFENPNQLADFYFGKFPPNTNRQLLNNVCSKIKMDPVFVDEMIAESPWVLSVRTQPTSLWNSELPKAATALTMSIIDPKMDRKKSVPPSEKELYIHLRQLVYQRLASLVKEAGFSAQTADDIIAFYRKLHNQNSDTDLINAALKRMKDRSCTYVGKFAVKPNDAPAAKTDSAPQITADERAILDSIFIKRAASNIVIRAFTGKASKKAMPLVRGEALRMFPIAVSLVHEHVKAMIRQLGRMDMHPLDMITLFDQTYKPADIEQIINTAKKEYRKLIYLPPTSLSKAVLKAAQTIERKGESGITPIPIKDDDTPITSNGKDSAANTQAQTSNEGMADPPQKLTEKEAIKKSIWIEYAANALTTELFEKHCSKLLTVKNVDVLAREKKATMARLKPIILKRINALGCDIKDSKSATAAIASYKNSFEESKDEELLKSVATEVSRLKMGFKNVKHEKKHAADDKRVPENNDGIREPPKPKSLITITAKSLTDKAILGITGEEKVSDEAIMKRIFNLFRGRCMRYVKESAIQRMLTLEEIEDLYRSKHSAAEDIETASFISASEVKKPDEIAPPRVKTEPEVIEGNAGTNFAEDTPYDNLNTPCELLKKEEPLTSGLTLPKSEQTLPKPGPTLSKPGPTLPKPGPSLPDPGHTVLFEPDELTLTIPGRVNKKLRKRLRKQLRLEKSTLLNNPETTKINDNIHNMDDGKDKKDYNTGNEDNIGSTDVIGNMDDGKDKKDYNTGNEDNIGNTDVIGNMDDDKDKNEDKDDNLGSTDDNMGIVDDKMGSADDNMDNIDDNMDNTDDNLGNIAIDELDISMDDLEDY